MINPPSSVNGNDWKPPSKAAPSPATVTTTVKVVADNPTQVEQFRAGNEKVLGWLVGQVMKATAGKANPAQVNELLRARL